MSTSPEFKTDPRRDATDSIRGYVYQVYQSVFAWMQLQKVTPARYASLIALSFFALSFIVAGHWVYVLFPNNTYLMSLALPFLAVFGIGYLSSNRR